MRSGRLLGIGLDADAVHLAATGLVRLATDEWLGGRSGAREWRWQLRAAAFADTWLAFDRAAAPGLRVPAGEVLRSVVGRAAELVLESHRGDRPAALEALGGRSARARERAHREDAVHPAEPAALALVWHGVQAIPDGDGDGHGGPGGPYDEWPYDERQREEQRITERCEAYVRERHHRQDTLALLLSCARTAAGALAELSDGDPHRAEHYLGRRAARHMPLGGLAPLWVPGRPARSTD